MNNKKWVRDWWIDSSSLEECGTDTTISNTQVNFFLILDPRKLYSTIWNYRKRKDQHYLQMNLLREKLRTFLIGHYSRPIMPNNLEYCLPMNTTRSTRKSNHSKSLNSLRDMRSCKILRPTSGSSIKLLQKSVERRNRKLLRFMRR